MNSIKIREFLPQIVKNIPEEWRGTTFKNNKLLGRALFAELLLEKASHQITENDLLSLGNAEDYLRVSSNISTLLELTLAQDFGIGIENCFTFASNRMALVALAKSTGLKVNLCTGDHKNFISPKELQILRLIDCKVELTKLQPNEDELNLCLISCYKKQPFVDAVIDDCVLYILNNQKINSDQILVMRKRMSTPITTPRAEEWLQELAGMKPTANQHVASLENIAELHSHLQILRQAFI